MITLYGFGRIFAEGRGHTKDLRVQWALEELGLEYQVHALDHTAGELSGEAYSRISPFHQAPLIDDNGFIVAESAQIVLYLAEKAGKLAPGDLHTRTRLGQWCFAAVSTVATPLMALDLIQMFDPDHAAAHLDAETRKIAQRFLADVERQLDRSPWIATDEFTVADVMMAGVLRDVRGTEPTHGRARDRRERHIDRAGPVAFRTLSTPTAWRAPHATCTHAMFAKGSAGVAQGSFRVFGVLRFATSCATTSRRSRGCRASAQQMTP
ncbi:glutathione S-transferase family protein [Variovorax sp. KK3]|uniref:glutathione S-transferase family protein n=1 Tax=Variovorax sp. KK3 TaxID=1855728 RepID=UPI00097BF1EA|nr:glutathione S-transferase family protein [Variovorax sp. KK3]